MTFAELVERAKRQCAWPEGEINLAACVMQAASRVAKNVMADASLCGLLQQEYSVTLNASGEANLLSVTGSVTGVAGEIMIEGVKYGVVLDADGHQLHPLKFYKDFVSPQATQYGYYCIKDKATILTRARDQQVNTALDIQSANGPLTVTANYTPASVDNFPEELEDMLVDELCRIVMSSNAES